MDKYAELRAALEAAGKGINVTLDGGHSFFDNITIRALLAERDALREALKVANDALEEISNEMTVGDRWTNAGQSLLDALPVARAALEQEQGD